MRAANDAVADLVPVDVVINTTLAAAWYSGSQTSSRWVRKAGAPRSSCSFGRMPWNQLWTFLSPSGRRTSPFTTARLVGSTRSAGGKLVGWPFLFIFYVLPGHRRLCHVSFSTQWHTLICNLIYCLPHLHIELSTPVQMQTGVRLDHHVSGPCCILKRNVKKKSSALHVQTQGCKVTHFKKHWKVEFYELVRPSGGVSALRRGHARFIVQPAHTTGGDCSGEQLTVA